MIIPYTDEFIYSDFKAHIAFDEELKKIGLFKEKAYDCEGHECASKRKHDSKVYENLKREKDLPDHVEGGSNNWAIHGNHTKSGKPILTADPHLGNSMPSTWHLSTLVWGEGKWDEFSLGGAFLPGIPFPLLGWNQNVSWAMTINLADISDIYEEKV